MPFCEVKCSYCHFAIDAQLLELESDHLRRTERGVLISNECPGARVTPLQPTAKTTTEDTEINGENTEDS